MAGVSPYRFQPLQVNPRFPGARQIDRRSGRSGWLGGVGFTNQLHHPLLIRRREEQLAEAIPVISVGVVGDFVAAVVARAE